MKKHILSSIALLILFLFATPHYVGGVSWDDDTTRPSLQRLQGLSVEVYIGQKEIEGFEKCSVNIEQIKTDVELKLRLAGIKVLSKKEVFEKIPGAPCLYVSIRGRVFEPSESFNVDLYVIHISVELLQMVRLVRTPQTELAAPTWGSSSTAWGSCKVLNSHIRDSVKDKMDKFINAYLSVNPKGEK